MKADLAGLTAAASAAGVENESHQFRVSLTNTTCDKCYPIVSFTWLLVPVEVPADKRDAPKAFIAWGLTTGKAFAEQLDYGRLPKQVVDKELIALSKL